MAHVMAFLSKVNGKYENQSPYQGVVKHVRFVPIADIPRGEQCAVTDEKQRDRLGHKAASKRDKGGDRGTGWCPCPSN